MKGAVPYPVVLRLAGREVCVVGGGRVAAHRVQGLLKAGARVRLIAPEAEETLQSLAAEDAIRWDRRPFSAPLLHGAAFVVCATDSEAVNRQAAWAAKAMGALVNMAAPPLELSDFTVPASVRRGDLLFSVSTGGASPALSHWLRGEIERSMADVYGPWLERLGPLRGEMKKRLAADGARRAFWRAALSDAVMALVREGRLEEAEAEVRDAVDRGGAEP